MIISSGTTTTFLVSITYQYFPGSDPEDAKISNTSISSVSNLFPGLVIEEGYIEDGDSMIYDRSLLHGVAKVTEGKRIVLVSWFSKHA